MYSRMYIAVVFVICLILSSPVRARIWYVERDGSGDFTTIQPAVDAASPGDTIRIGPGRYTEYEPLTVPGWTEDVYVAIQTDSLTLIGSGPDVTIIGPEEPFYEPTEMPKGIAGIFISDLSILNLTVENIRDGIYRSEGQLVLTNSIIRGCDLGLVSWTDCGMRVKDCQFLDNLSRGLITFDPACDIEVRDSFFSNISSSISFNSTDDAFVHNCEFHGGTTGVKIQSYSSGGIFDCRFENIAFIAIYITTASQAVIERNLIIGGYRNIDIITVSHVSGTQNVLSGGQVATIKISHSTLDFTGNHIFNNGGYTVFLEAFFNPPDVIVDLSENYWGTMNTDTIETWIWDGHDDPDIHAFVDFEPISDFILDADTPTARTTDILKVKPNPFNPQTELTYTLAQDGLVRLAIYDLLGRNIAVLIDGHRPVGPGSVTWDGRDKGGSAVASGVYIARLETAQGVSTQKLVLAR